MPYYVDEGSSNGNYTHPIGQFAAICIDIVDLGICDTKFGKKKKVALRYWCGKHNEEGKILYVQQRFTPTLHENGNMRPFLERWRGRKFTTEELKKFDLEKLLKAPAFIQVGHDERNGRTYSNIESIMRLPDSLQGLEYPKDYVRECDKPKDDQPPGASASPWDADDDDLPF